MIKNADINLVKKLRVGIIIAIILISISIVIFASKTTSACFYTIGTYEDDYNTEKNSFYKGEIVYGKGTADYNVKIILRIKDPYGNIVFYSNEEIYEVTGFFLLNQSAPTGTWNIQLGVKINDCWQWSTNTGMISYFTVSDANFTLAINADGDGYISKEPDKEKYDYGDVVDLTAIADPCWSFDSWSGDLGGNENPAEILMDGNKIVTAEFTELLFNLTINVEPSGSGVVNVDPVGPFYCSDIVNLNAVPYEGFEFYYWSGDLGGYENPAEIIMDDNKTVTAHFVSEEIYYTLCVEVEGNGNVVKDPDQFYYYPDEVVNLSAIAETGWSFENWTGDLISNDETESLIMNSNKFVEAHFKQNQYTLTIEIEGNGTVLKNPDQTSYIYGSIIELTANPGSGYVFGYWSGNFTGDSNPIELNMTEDKYVTAHFNVSSNVVYIFSNSGHNLPPKAFAGGPYYGYVNETITFNGSKSYDRNNRINSYHWDLGDGTIAYGEIVTHFYSEVGEYKVVLTVTDTKSATGSDETFAIIIKPNNPPSEPNITGLTEGIINTVYEFGIISTDDGGKIRYTVDWGDGKTTESLFIESGILFNASHKWANPGIYTINVKADDGETNTTSQLTIKIVKPDIPKENNFILILLALLALMVLILILLLAKKEEEEE